MSADDNKILIRRRIDEIWHAGDQGAIDELIAENYVSNGQPIGREGFRQFVAAVRTAFPDMRFTTDDMVAEGDRVAVRYTASGTHQGEFQGIPATGRQVSFTGIDMFRVSEGKLVEEHLNFDQLTMLQQLGVIPGPEQAADSPSATRETTP